MATLVIHHHSCCFDLQLRISFSSVLDDAVSVDLVWVEAGNYGWLCCYHSHISQTLEEGNEIHVKLENNFIKAAPSQHLHPMDSSCLLVACATTYSDLLLQIRGVLSKGDYEPKILVFQGHPGLAKRMISFKTYEQPVP